MQPQLYSPAPLLRSFCGETAVFLSAMTAANGSIKYFLAELYFTTSLLTIHTEFVSVEDKLLLYIAFKHKTLEFFKPI